MQTVDYQRVNGGGVNYQTSLGKNLYLEMNSQLLLRVAA